MKKKTADVGAVFLLAYDPIRSFIMDELLTERGELIKEQGLTPQEASYSLVDSKQKELNEKRKGVDQLAFIERTKAKISIMYLEEELKILERFFCL